MKPAQMEAELHELRALVSQLMERTGKTPFLAGAALDEAELLAFVGSQVQVWSANFIYSGKLVAVRSSYLFLTGCGVVYETGELTAKTPKDFQPFSNGNRVIFRSAIESVGAP